MAKPSRSKRQGRSPSSNKGSTQPSEPEVAAMIDPAEEKWAKLRHGAQNVAGVSWQVAMSVHLMCMARAGQFPYVSFVPEGEEDLDCVGADGSQLLVQMKEVGAGVGHLGASKICDAMLHIRHNAVRKNLVIVTDGQLTSGLKFTGWEQTLAELESGSTVRLAELLADRGTSPGEVISLFEQTRIITFPWNIREITERILVSELKIHPAIAAFAVEKLYSIVSGTSSDQRATTFASRLILRIDHIDSVLHEVQDTVDVNGLEVAISSGVCAPADLLHRSDISSFQFYQGVDGAPSHIAAGLDVIRLNEMEQITDALGNERYAFILGPSGAGKSVLLWRAARDAILGGRVVRVRRVENSTDVDNLGRHVKLQRPSRISPVIVVADNLGRPGMESWSSAVSTLLELPHVVLMASCREEDFHPLFVRGIARIIEPKLDEFTAELLAQRVQESGIELRMVPTDAYERCHGLMMEYLALLTTGRHMEWILSEQVEGLKSPDRKLQRTAARLVVSAHGVGLSLSAQRLGLYLSKSGDTDEIGDALSVLKGEHMIMMDGDRWRGLHELRSQMLTEQIHASPPPTLADTYASVARMLEPSEISWLLRRLGQVYPQGVLSVAQAIGEWIAEDPRISSSQVADILEGAERADNGIYAKVAIPILANYKNSGLSYQDAAGNIYCYKHQQRYPIGSNTGALEKAFSHWQRVADELPDRESGVVQAISSSIGSDRLVWLIQDTDMSGMARLLEASAGTIGIEAFTVGRIFAVVRLPSNDEESEMYSRSIRELSRYVELKSLESILGTLMSRAIAVVRAVPNAVSVSYSGSERKVMVRILASFWDENGLVEIPWESQPRSSNDRFNDMAFAVARRVLFACPEVRICEITTVNHADEKLSLNGLVYGYKAIARDSLFDVVGVRQNVGFQAAVRRLNATESWTQLVSEQVAVSTRIATLLTDAPARLYVFDKSGRRNMWIRQLADVRASSKKLAAKSAIVAPLGSVSQSVADEYDRSKNEVSAALENATDALNQLVHGDVTIGDAIQLRSASEKLGTASGTMNPTLAHVGTPITDDLIERLDHLGRLTLLVVQDSSTARKLGGRITWDTVRELVDAAAQLEQDSQSTALHNALDDIVGAEVVQIPNRNPAFFEVSKIGWFIEVPMRSWNDFMAAVGQPESARKVAVANLVIAAPVNGNQVLKAGLQFFQSDKMPSVPVGEEMLRIVSSDAGRTLAAWTDEANSIKAIFDKLGRYSWHLVLKRARPAEWPFVDSAEIPAFSELRIAAKMATNRFNKEFREIHRQALEVLIDQVAEEEAGTAKTSMTAQLFSIQARHTPSDLDERKVWNAISACLVAVAYSEIMFDA